MMYPFEEYSMKQRMIELQEEARQYQLSRHYRKDDKSWFRGLNILKSFSAKYDSDIKKHQSKVG
ncbi:hypothetical protein H1D32_02735 [Anaerobacillus sp. CMMVII]|uniref:hypothetical protein n=1 Tax=Anaerobacillus sp. CMMVII TaxID=2755588 RepID=UPI0021B74480|nr:hypothetical protein [Anaerobacillus sp. CMMVII]MCT8136765.1 hypothetical protein [Anaerobacillus sp. CMMVII]